MDEQKVTIKFDGQYHQVDLTTFTNVLLIIPRLLGLPQIKSACRALSRFA